MGQCEYITKRGQCTADAKPGSKFCARHKASAKSTLLGQYRLACSQLEDAPERHADTDNLKSLVAEIAILRSLVEKRLNMMRTEEEVLRDTPAIQSLCATLEKLINSGHQLEVKLGKLLNKAALMQLAQEIIRIIERRIRPLPIPSKQVDEIIEKVGSEMVQAIAEQENSSG